MNVETERAQGHKGVDEVTPITACMKEGKGVMKCTQKDSTGVVQTITISLGRSIMEAIDVTCDTNSKIVVTSSTNVLIKDGATGTDIGLPTTSFTGNVGQSIRIEPFEAIGGGQ